MGYKEPAKKAAYNKAYNARKRLDPEFLAKRREAAIVAYQNASPERLAYRAQWGRRRRVLEKIEALAHYGRDCYCCGESTVAMLTIDHIDGQGSAHRQSLSTRKVSRNSGYTGTQFYRWLRKNGWPKGYRTACFNCNYGAFANGGICPGHGLSDEESLSLVPSPSK